ncbi:hypothetical protein EV356DRAFT_537949 [Viridothelium virens]|uniref:Tyrosine specific protein phosphatases domain-containing protein n=1 Tax=Viridothelium virens TaxID=1048519 RepID=A0A6A6GS56_VIRVR|nr:hypothetical protein EV356DRAFT_537949 [Viridothelium virens]
MTATRVRRGLLAISAFAFLAGIKLFIQRPNNASSSLELLKSWQQVLEQLLGRQSSLKLSPNLLTTICSLVFGVWFAMEKRQVWQKWLSCAKPDDAENDNILLKQHSDFLSYTLPDNGFTYPMIRTFYRPHPQANKLPSEPAALPLMVFVHGLGGSIAQFAPLLTSLVNVGPCLGIDFPGCGLSKFEPTSWDAYTIDTLTRLLASVIDQYRDASKSQGVVLIGHSMGSSIAALLASSTSPYSQLLSHHVLGLVAVCPKATPPSERTSKNVRILLSMPTLLFDLWRSWNRRGGTESASVASFVGPNADEETKRLQLRFNEQSRTPVFRRMARGALPDYSSSPPNGGLPGKDVWTGLQVPVYLIAGSADQITPVAELEQIKSVMGNITDSSCLPTDTMPVAAAPIRIDSVVAEKRSDMTGDNSEERATQDGTCDSHPDIFPFARPRQRLLRSNVLPPPAAHALLYSPTTCRVLAGLIENFLAECIDQRLSLSWQLQHLATEGKWDVKNLQKWQGVAPVSKPIGNSFRAMKTMREVDELHSPAIFVQQWQGKVYAVIDISSGEPVYAPEGLEKGGIKYYKFATISKQPPTAEEVRDFIALVDKVKGSTATEDNRAGKLIGVHCHYGFNRTGFFIVSYLVEREGYRVEDAIEEFARQRPPGIRHEHFIDALHLRFVGFQATDF